MFKKISHITTIENEPLYNHCTFKIGGNARFFIEVFTPDALIETIYLCAQHDMPFKIIGGGSNLLFDDLGFNGAIIKYSNNEIKQKDETTCCSTGISLSQLTNYAISHNLKGFDFAIGVPATLGGAIVNNLGAYNEDVSQHLVSVTILQNKQIKYLNKSQCNFNYHSSAFQKSNAILLAASFNFPTVEKNQSFSKMQTYLTKRKNSQPLEHPNAGSIFKRTENCIPAKLIQDANLKGTKINDAQISIKHSGFIINTGNATCKDVLTLIELIQDKIYDIYKIKLQPEIEYCPYIK